jgi:hypothetical protein
MSKNNNAMAKRKAAKKVRRANRAKSRTLGERAGKSAAAAKTGAKALRPAKQLGQGQGPLVPSKSHTRHTKKT